MSEYDLLIARHGRRFDNRELQAYFNNQSWYNGTIASKDFDDSVFSDVERKNIDRIVKVEAER